MTNKQISFAYPNYSQNYYAYMFKSIIKKLISNNERVFYFGPNFATRHGASTVIVSINEARDKLNIKNDQKLVLWLQDCPYSKYKKLITNKNSIKKGDVILFAAPNYFGFNWEELIDRGIKIDYLFYGYNDFFDLGVNFIKNKFKKENLDKFLKINEINTSKIIDRDISNEVRLLQKNCKNPIIVFHGFYETRYEASDDDSIIPLAISGFKYDNENLFTLLLSPSRLFKFLLFILKDFFSRYNVFKRKYEKNTFLKFRKLYISFKGLLSNKEYIKNIQNYFVNKDIIHDYSRFIEREHILNSMQDYVERIDNVKYSQSSNKKNTLLIGDGLIRSKLIKGHHLLMF